MLAADKGISANDAAVYSDELCVLHDSSTITYADAWGIIQSEEYVQAVGEFNMYKSFGLPRSGGWKDQSVVWVAYVTAVDRAVKMMAHAQLERVKP